VAAEKNTCGRIFILFFTESYLVGAQKKYAQTPSTVVLYNIFNAITLFINITIAKKGPSRNIIHVMNLCFQNGRPS
jgi:hypothetical protein